MMLSRRQMLAATGAGVLAGWARMPLAAADGAPAFVSCCRKPDGAFAAVVLDGDGRILFTEELDARGHGAAVSPDAGKAVVFARRPGRFAVVLDLARRERVAAFAPPEDRRFAGHGFFQPDGKVLYATENDFDGERGMIGVYDATDGFRRIGEFPTHGIGPHEALLLSDGRTAAVANGGILTHPDFPRLDLNIPTMEPSLALIDIATGDLLENAVLDPRLHQLSIRHIAEAGDGSVWFGGQYEGPKTDRVPLVGSLHRDRGLTLVEADDDIYAGMNQYVGSVAVSRDGATVATTSPRGGCVVEWDVASLAPVRVRREADACGVAPRSVDFLVSTGSGHILAGEEERAVALAFDNHLMRIVAEG
ncbi:DUF1513 domain-containing protein [Acuticoccus mangrovi]|uniref:DUF1513 domain-containing protein n=1 Tax=Acuticoccus mangrovi TaxID=2796142 RepID=A0A934IDL1_9HYPH|nr:DUF1513 domain-containing protein [Acuticoccus mangrovi]MBJ3774604.1 DUF1513 domain-containing protein [Acuticoccus mangrovi]